MPLDQLITEHRLAHWRDDVLGWLGWLFHIVLRIGPCSRSRRLRRFVLRHERRVEALCFLMAFRRSSKIGERARIASARRGFRMVRGHRRLFFKSARIRARGASLALRAFRLLEVTADPEPYVARFLRKILRGLCSTHLIVSAPPDQALAGVLASPRAQADTS